MPITHPFVSGKADGGDATLVRPSNWNEAHTGFSDPVICIAYRSGTQNISNNTDTAVTFNAELSDAFGMHDNVTNTSRIVFDRAGWWNVRGHAFFQANSAGIRYGWLKLSGVDVEGSAMRTLSPGSTGGISVVAERNINASASAYVELWVHQNSGSTLTIGHATITPIYSLLEVRYIGP